MIASGKIVFLLTFFAYLAQCLVFFNDRPDELLVIPLVLILAGVGAYALGRNPVDPDAELQLNLFFWAFSLRLWLGIFFYGWDLTALFGDEDASGYMSGWGVAENWYRNGFEGFASDLTRVFFDQQNLGQSIIWGIPMFIAGGPSRMIVSVINSFAGSLLVIVIFRMARRVFGSETARIAGILVTFWASFILLSAGTSKEMLVIFFEWVILYLLIRNPKGLTVTDGMFAFPAFLAVFMMRFYAVYLMAAAFLFRTIVAQKKNLLRNALFGSAVVISIMIFLSAGGAISRDFSRLERQNQVIDTWRVNMARETGTGVEIYAEYQSTSVAIPVATVYFFLAPFPWEMFSGSGRNGFGAAENIFIFAIIILGFPALKIFFSDKFYEMAPIFVFCVLYAGLHIWGLANVGLAWRHKQTIMPLLFILVAVSITQRKAGWAILRGRMKRKKKLSGLVHSQ
ncbi:MAG TPA: hypothetical protein DEA22_06140 [Blastocatellia bacterium]|nr:hypothetical protein [Blastocatellia bacterium]